MAILAGLAYALVVHAHQVNQEINEQHSIFVQPYQRNGIIQGTILIPSVAWSHNIRASKNISEEALRQYLSSKHSPLVTYSSVLLQSPYYSTIIAITAAEESFSKNPICKSNGLPSWNFYGMMKKGGESAGLRCFDSIMDGWNYMNDYLASHEDKYPTIESWKGVYCQSACLSWYPTIIKTKLELESL